MSHPPSELCTHWRTAVAPPLNTVPFCRCGELVLLAVETTSRTSAASPESTADANLLTPCAQPMAVARSSSKCCGTAADTRLVDQNKWRTVVNKSGHVEESAVPYTPQKPGLCRKDSRSILGRGPGQLSERRRLHPRRNSASELPKDTPSHPRAGVFQCCSILPWKSYLSRALT